jgi:hypothetical protein
MRRTLTIAAVLTAGVVVGATVIPAGNGEAATPKTYSLTVSGTDAHTLDPGDQPAFVNGGGVVAIAVHTHYGSQYFEVGLPLPVGAKVTSIAISYQSSYVNTTGTYFFGSYAPARLATQSVFSVTPPVSSTATSYVKTGSPITTVAAGRRYVIDWQFPMTSNSADPTIGVFFGATVKYTCAAPCVP